MGSSNVEKRYKLVLKLFLSSNKKSEIDSTFIREYLSTMIKNNNFLMLILITNFKLNLKKKFI